MVYRDKCYRYDLPDNLDLGSNVIAVDTEAMGLNNRRDRLCLVQLFFDGKGGGVRFVQFPKTCPAFSGQIHAPVLASILSDPRILKIFHYARFDVAILQHNLGIEVKNIYCTKIASKLARTYTDNHGLKSLCRDELGVNISKQQQSSDWGEDSLSVEQLEYAAGDVLYLHKLREVLNKKLERDGKMEIAQRCFDFISTLAQLDLNGWDENIFSH